MLEGVRNVVILSMFHDMAGDNVFDYLAADKSQGDRSVVCGNILLSFLVHRGNVGFTPNIWNDAGIVRLPTNSGEYVINLTREFFEYSRLDVIWSSSFVWIKSMKKFFYTLACNIDVLGSGKNIFSG